MRYRNKPVEIEAFQWEGPTCPYPGWLVEELSNKRVQHVTVKRLDIEGHPEQQALRFANGAIALVGYFIIREDSGDLTPVKPELFALNFEPAVVH